MDKTELLYEKYLEGRAVSTDTRNITPGSVFFALKGPNFNANEFAREALKKGASYVVVDEERFAVNDKIIPVDDSLSALQHLATLHRKHLNIPVIGLTGSNGKTTTKELLGAVLNTTFRTLITKGNLNNHIGVPLTILAIDPSIEIAVIEMGANHLREIASLCAMANPTHGLITNIGKAHIGTFGGFENIVRGKSELFQHVLSADGVAFIYSGDPALKNMARRFEAPVLYPESDDFYHCEFLGADPFVKIKTEKEIVIQTQMIGHYNFSNIAAALCVAKYFKVDANKADAAVANYVPGNMRSQVITRGTNTIILDAYNANPSSMEAAIENLAALKGGKKIVILGDMFELEEETENEHRKLGALLAEKDFNKVYLCGELVKHIQNALPSASHFRRIEDLINALVQTPIRNSIILVKASRGIGLEAIVDYL